MSSHTAPLTRRLIAGIGLLAVGSLGLFALARPAPGGPSDGQIAPAHPHAAQMEARFVGMWSDPARYQDEVKLLQALNPEWDFMGRTFLVLALSSQALAEPETATERLALVDRVIEDTVAFEAAHGQNAYLMDYATWSPWVDPSGRSLFVDGEIALMIGARRLVAPAPHLAAEHRLRIERSVALISGSPALMGESYPDEAWLFCNTAALAAIALFDAVEGTDHSDLLQDWVVRAGTHLVDPETGILVSSTTRTGQWGDGPEGSSIWFSAHMLQFVDPALAQVQYVQAREHLGRSILGFGYAREWAADQAGFIDVDAGIVVPVLMAGSGSSGLAILGARAFGDDDWHASLMRSLDTFALPRSGEGERRYGMSNGVGDAAILYGLVEGPLRARLAEKKAAQAKHGSKSG